MEVKFIGLKIIEWIVFTETEGKSNENTNVDLDIRFGKLNFHPRRNEPENERE